MRKVLIVGTTDLYGGVGQIMFNLCRYIDSTKVKFDFMYYVDATDDEKRLIRELGGTFYLVPRYSKHPLKFFRYITNFYRNNQYDCVHLHASTAMLIMYIFPLLFNRKVKVVFHSHISIVPVWYDKILHKLFRCIVVCRTDTFLAVSDLAAIFMYGNSIASQERYIQLKNGIVLENFKYNVEKRNELRDALDIKDNFVVGHIGRFTKQKNQTFLLDVFKSLLDKCDNAILLLVGTGELEEEIRQAVADRGLNKNVIFYGTTQKIYDIIQAMDVFLLPSKWEGLPIVAIEAQAAGLPVVASNNVSCETAITPLYHSMDLYSDPVDKWAEKVLSLKGAKRLNYTSEIIHSGYDISHSAKELEAIYCEVVQGENT